MPSRSTSRSPPRKSSHRRSRSRSRSRSPRRDYSRDSHHRRSPRRDRSRSPVRMSSSAATAFWQEERRKLRMERTAERNVWERSPSPPRYRYGDEEGEDKKKAAPAIRQREPSPPKRNRPSAIDMANKNGAANKSAESNGGREKEHERGRERETKASSSKSKSKRRSASPSSSSSSSSSSSESDDDRKHKKKHRKHKKHRKDKKNDIKEAKKDKSPEKARSTSPVSALDANTLFPPPAAAIPTPTTAAAAAFAASATPAAATAVVMAKGSFTDESEAIKAMQEVAAAAERRKQAANPTFVAGMVAEDEDMVGPRPLPKIDPKVKYGGSLLAGEGDAMARFVQENKRIPRRGEIGLTSDQISKYEDAGFVMSGSRHRRMNAVRMRKEAQVYGAEEQKALAMLNFEEKVQKETKVLAGFRQMLASKLTSQKMASAENQAANAGSNSNPASPVSPTSPVANPRSPIESGAESSDDEKSK